MEWRTSALCILLLALTCGTLVNAKRVYASNHVNTICSMWGNFHFTTFDGETYQFKGTCEYNLVSDCHSLIRQFSVYVKRTQDPKDSKISRLSVTINDIAVVMTETLVTVNEQNVTLPIHVAGILVEKNAIYTKLYSKIGISVMWNRDDSVLVELDSKYSGHTCGLCGDFNGIALNDEFIHSGRKLGYVEFGNMHRVHDPSHYCEDPFEEVEEQNAGGRCEEHQEICGDILENKDWSSCSWVLSPLPYIKACANDVCNRQPGETNTTSLCSTLSEYSRQCSHAGGTPPNWRTSNFCSVKCPYNMVYSESGSPCMDTCSHRDTNTLCEEHKVDGCFCPPGTVFDDTSNTGCIPLKQCQCKHDHVYNAGEVLQQEGEECVCDGGNWICKSLPSPGLCAVEEGSHFTTYDGKEFTFHGDCNYLLSKDCEGSKFIILGKIVPCINLETDTCLKSIVVLIDNDKKNPLIIKADGTVQHNAEVLLPYTTADFTVFRPSSFHIMFQTAFGLQVQVQLVPLMQVYITVDQSFQGKTCGLCGNFNKVLSDDLKTPQGMVEGTATSFANAWKVQSNCPDRKERMDDPCSYSTNSEHFAEHWCSKMKDKESLFAKCHVSVNPDSYYKRCKYSSCTCEKSEECLCAVFSSYARACAAKGIFLQGWRHLVCEKYTENCPASQNYSYQLQSCQSTCQSLSSERQDCSDDFVPVDGCACPKGLYQDEKGVCVPMEKCPCYHNGLKVQPGRSVSIKDEHCVCMNGKLHCRSWKPRFLDCSSPKVYFNCSTAGQNENGLECAQTCLQQNVDCFSLECESGCQCPTGLLDDGRGNCVTPHNCPCSHNGQFYAPGAQITMDCNKCTCQHGTWKCTEHSCPGICTIYGSGHYQTFDQQRFGFIGDCSYIAVQDKCGNKTGQFSVVTENIPCGTTGTTCSKAVDIILGRTRLDLSDDKVTATDTGVGPLIKYNERKVGMYIVIDAENGLTVLWDRITTVRIILQPQHSGQVCGLCGNFNGDGKDDFTTQGNLQTTNVLEFVDSWKAASNCPDSEMDIDPCVATPNRHTWAKIQCSIIKEDTFKDCHSKVDPNPYYENCVKDSCACDTGGDCECFCTAVAAYAQACNEADVCVVWRTPEICPVYCDYYNNPGDCTWHYSPCHTPCYKTCLNPEGICNNTLPNLEGCYPKCPEDKPIFDEKNQICVEACNGTCYINGTEFNPGEEIPTEEPCQICICDENGKIQCFQKPGCCYYNGTEYGDNEIIYNVTDGMGMCYYAICINTTVIETQEPCKPSPPPPESTTTTTITVSTTESTTPSQPPKPPTVSTSSPTPTKITTTSSGTPETMSPCVDICEWSEWFNVYNPVTGGGNDFETYENIKESGKKICEHPEDIECRAVNKPDMSFEEFVDSSKQVVQCNVSYGLQCEKKQQNARPYKCFDYEIRVLCCFPCSTPSPTTTPTFTFSTTQTPLSSTSRPSTTSSQTPKPPTVSTSSPTPTKITTTTTGTPPGSTPTTKMTQSTTMEGSTTSSQTPKPSTVSTSSPTPTEITTTTTGTPTGSTPQTETVITLSVSTSELPITTGPIKTTLHPSTGEQITGSTTTKPTPTEKTTTTQTPPGSTPTTEVTQSTTVSTTSPQTPRPPTVSTTSPTPTKTTTGIPTGSTTTTKLTQSTTGVGSTTSSQTPKPPTVSTSPTPTERTTTTQTPPGSTPTTEVTQSTTVSTTSPQTPKPPTVSTTPPTPTKTTTGIPTGSTTTTKLTQSTTGFESTTSSQTPKPPTVSTSPTPTERTTTTQTPPGSTPTTEVTQSTTLSTTSPQTPKPPTVSTTSPTPTIITTTTTTTGTPTVSSTRPGSTTPTASTKPLTTTIKTTLSTTTRPSTTLCFCEFNGTQYEPGETILDNVHLGSGICLTMVCSDICVIQNTTNPCPTSPTPTPTPYYDCPEWDKNTNETFIICNCTMARCIEDNIIEIIPYECPPLQNITCANGKNPVLVYDEHYCCQHYACDCFCEGWGDPHYITFDGTFYSYQGNCTYTLMEEIRPHYHLKIYIDNVYCDPIEHVSCPRSIIVSYNNLIITLTNHNLFGGAELEASINNEKLRLPFSRNAVRVVSSSLDLFLEIPQLGVIVTFGATGFSINLPFQHFGNNTQGHCGTCNNNRADDCMLPGGILVSDCAVMADYWPANFKNGEICTKPTVLPTVGTSPKPTPSNCQALPECNLLHSKLFEQCHHYVSPDNFFLGCHYDSCHMSNPAVVCTSLQTYARTCSQFGLCINWRNYTSLCNIECPTNKIFKPCGPAEPQTCEDQPEERSLEIPTEGCFCPDGMMLFNKVSDVCVEKCGCLDASETPREFGEVFEYNCEVCVCERATKSINCKPKQCLDSVPESCTLPGLVLVNVTDPSDPCCTKQVCNCDTSTCPSLKNVCEIGYSSELEVPEGKCCPEIICVPKKVCVFDNKEYEPGTPIPVVNCQECTCTREVDPKTQLFKISCKMVTCNEVCNPGYEYQEPVSYKDCCGKCVQTHCIINVNGTQHILKEGEVLPTTDRDCDRITCTKVNGQFITDNYRVQCPAFNISNCQPGTVQLMADGCCYFCVDKIKGCQVQVVQDYIVHDGCQSENKIDLTFCEGDCGSYSRYTEPKLSACSCCQATNISNRTVSLGCPSGAKIHHTYIQVNECTCSKTACHETGFNQHKLENSRKKRDFQLT